MLEVSFLEVYVPLLNNLFEGTRYLKNLIYVIIYLFSTIYYFYNDLNVVVAFPVDAEFFLWKRLVIIDFESN